MKYCCDMMDENLLNNKVKGDFDSDDIICYTLIFDEWGIVVHDGFNGGGTSYIKIDFCPWCGKKLPESKRNRWFDELEKLGIESPFEEDIPEEFNSDKWWREKMTHEN